MGRTNDAWLRRHAVMIASQLPEDPNDAERVLELALELVNGFMRPHAGPEMAQDRVLAFRGLPASPNRSASSSVNPTGSPYQSQSVVKPGTA